MTSTDTPLDELGIYLLGGRVKDPARAIDEARTAESLGLTSAWVAERFDMKELGVLSGAVAASTETIKFGMGSIAAGTRTPAVTAAMGATFVQAFGPRLHLGLARGLWGINEKGGMGKPTMAGFEDYAKILKQLWAGETVNYDGPAGRFTDLRMPDPPTAPAPPIILSSWAPGPKATDLSARVFDGVFIGCELTVEATRNICTRLRQACERVGRDPASLWIANTMLCAPEMSSDELLLRMNARAITHLSFPGIPDLLLRENGWDPEPMRQIMATPEMSGNVIADQAFTRDQLVELGQMIPPEWIETGMCVGTSAQVAVRLQDYLDAGLDHLVLHGSAPDQLTATIAAFRTNQGQRADPAHADRARQEATG